MEVVRSKGCKIFKKLTSISKNTSTAEIEGGSRDLRLSSTAIGLRERPQDGYLLH